MCPTAIPKRSIVALLPSITEKEKRTQGRNGAVNGKRPRKLIRTIGFLCPQIYTIIKVKEEPKNCTFTKGATICVYVCVCVCVCFHNMDVCFHNNVRKRTVMIVAPTRSMNRKSAVLPLKCPSSNNREYRTRKYI